MIAFSCPHCGKGLEVKDEFAGRKGRCQHCQQPLAVPAAPAGVVPAGAGGRPGRAPAPPPAEVDDAEETRAQAPTGRSGEGTEAVPSRPAVAPEHCDFLAPAQGPGEVGRLGGYRILEVLGAGGMGVVYRAEDVLLGRLVALKVMLPALAGSEAARKRFLREARTAASVEHDHVVAIHQVGEDRGVPFLAMPLLKGEPLDDRLRRGGRLPVAEVLRVGREAAEGLAAAHRHGLIHRDIKPANIFLEGERGRVKILDFGLARAVSEESQLTQQGAILGTPAYMAPEQARGQTLDARCDLFSLGCVLYRLCAGETPFKGKDTISTLKAVTTETPRPLSDLNPEVPRALADLVAQLLTKDPAGRPASAAAVAGELAAMERALAADAAPPAPTVVGSPAAAPAPPAAKPRKSAPVPASRPAAERPIKSAAPPPAPRPAAERPLKGAGPPPAPPPARRRSRWPLAALGVAFLLAVGGTFAAITINDRRPPAATTEETPKETTKGGETVTEAPDVFFNGKDLNGWTGSPRIWSVKDGALVGVSKGLKGNACLHSNKKYRDFTLKCRVRLKGDKANAGVQVRSDLFGPARLAVKGPRGDMGPGLWGNLFGERTGGVLKAAPAAEIARVLRPDAFNDYSIRCVGKHVTIRLNGVTTVDDDFADLPEEGVIAWTLHSGPAQEATFKDIEFTEVPPQSGWVQLFNGKDLAGWKVYPAGTGNWKVEDGAIVVGGPTSYLFSERGDYDNFHCRFEARINERGNSGVLFRARFGPGLTPGYEAQINIVGDAVKTGSLFPNFNPALTPEEKQKVTVKDVLTRPDTWFTQDVIAGGNHLVVKVNGRTTVDFVDRRNTNSRGCFALQHLGPATVAKFRKIEVRPLPPAKKP